MMSIKINQQATKSNLSDLDLNMQHLQAELTRIDVLIQHQVRRWQIAGQDPNDVFRGLYLSDLDAERLAYRPLGTTWGHTVALDPAEEQAFALVEAEAVAEVQRVIDSAQKEGRSLRLLHLANRFELTRFEVDVLLIALAPMFDLRYEQLYGYLQDNLNRKRPSLSLVLELLGDAGTERLVKLESFAEDAPLRQYQLLNLITEGDPVAPPLLAQTLASDPALTAWLMGTYRPHPDLGRKVHYSWPGSNETDRVLAGTFVPQLKQAIEADAILGFHGPDTMRQTAAARLLALMMERPLLQVDLAASEDECSPLQVIRLALRDARMTDAVLFLRDWDVCLNGDNTVSPSLLAELSNHPGPLVIASRKPWQRAGGIQQRKLHRLPFPIADFQQRCVIWRHLLQEYEPENTIEPATAAALAGQFTLTTQQIQDAVLAACDRASERGTILKTEDLFTTTRAHSNPRLSELARQITPRFDWDDIILPEDQRAILREIVDTVCSRPLVLEEWGVGCKLAASAGVTVLFVGPPGTGKTMAAEVIAAELKMDLYKIDLSNVVSKYIGETEKNLERIFTEAASSNAILFFDEADAIFGKRAEVKDAHDRYANIETSYLLQRMEVYDGVTILATNLRANLDDAFTRRLHFAVDFPFPEAADRLRIWQTLFPPDVPRQPDLDFTQLAHRFELAGGNIRNIIVSAAYRAAANGGQVTMTHLQDGLRRELQKMGRLVGESSLELR